MGLLDGPLRTVASILTQKLGATATLRRENTDFDFETDENVERDPDTWSIPITPIEEFEIKELQEAMRSAGTTIVGGDFLVTTPALYLEQNSVPVPEVGMYLLQGGITYRIKTVGRKYSGDLIAQYVLHCGK